MNKSLIVLLLIAVIGIVFTMVFRTYTVRQVDTDGHLLWNDHEAYVFVGANYLGWSRNYLQMSGTRLLRPVLGSPQPDDRRSSVVVLRCTAGGVERFEAKNTASGEFAVFENQVYLASGGGGGGQLLKWVHANFEPASVAEQQRFERANVSFEQFSDVNGWSHRCCLLSRPPGPVELQLGSQVVGFVFDRDPAGRWAAIEFRRPGAGAERILILDEEPRRVSSNQYHELFNN